MRSPGVPGASRRKYWPTARRDRALVARPPCRRDAYGRVRRLARSRGIRTETSRRASVGSQRSRQAYRRPAARDNSFHVGFPSVVLVGGTAAHESTTPAGYAGQPLEGIAPKRIPRRLFHLSHTIFGRYLSPLSPLTRYREKENAPESTLPKTITSATFRSNYPSYRHSRIIIV